MFCGGSVIMGIHLYKILLKTTVQQHVSTKNNSTKKGTVESDTARGSHKRFLRID